MMETQITACRRASMREAKRRGLSTEDAEEIAQDVSVRLWQRLDAGTDIRSIAAWSITATRRLVIDHRRRSKSGKRGADVVESLEAMQERDDLRLSM